MAIFGKGGEGLEGRTRHNFVNTSDIKKVFSTKVVSIPNTYPMRCLNQLLNARSLRYNQSKISNDHNSKFCGTRIIFDSVHLLVML